MIKNLLKTGISTGFKKASRKGFGKKSKYAKARTGPFIKPVEVTRYAKTKKITDRWLAAGVGFTLGAALDNKINRKAKKAKESTSKFKNKREKWSSEESYVPQTQRKKFGGHIVPGKFLRQGDLG